jgi:hypothetical protein
LYKRKKIPNMKKYFLIIATSLLLISCNEKGKTEEAAGADSPFVENIVRRNIVPTSSLEFIENWNGKTAMEAGMFEDSVLVKRLENLLENEFQYFKENWNVQTPIQKVQGIYSASGCKQNDCSSYYSVVYFDVKNNNINVLIKRGIHSKLFTENGEIPLPEELKEDQRTIRANA